MHRLAALAVLALGCGRSEEKSASPPPPPPKAEAPVVPTVAVAPEPTPPPEVVPVPVDAGPSFDSEVDRYLGAYLDMLWVDLFVMQLLGTYPGVPPTNRYTSYSFKWDFPDRDKIEAALERAAIAAHATSKPSATDRAVAAYTEQVRLAWGDLRALTDYYNDKRFVDDEFERGRRDKALVNETYAKIVSLRAPMIEAVLKGWRVVAGDKPQSPRAILSAAWESCTRVALLIYARRPGDENAAAGTKEAANEKAIDVGMSACRRGVGDVSALPAAYRSFENPLRAAAVGFGDALNAEWSRKYALDDLDRLVRAYTAQWPKLPAEPAERVE